MKLSFKISFIIILLFSTHFDIIANCIELTWDSNIVWVEDKNTFFPRLNFFINNTSGEIFIIEYIEIRIPEATCDTNVFKNIITTVEYQFLLPFNVFKTC